MYKLIPGNARHQVFTFNRNDGGIIRPIHAMRHCLELRKQEIGGYFSIQLGDIFRHEAHVTPEMVESFSFPPSLQLFNNQRWQVLDDRIFSLSDILPNQNANNRLVQKKLEYCLEVFSHNIAEQNAIVCAKAVYTEPRAAHSQGWELVLLEEYDVVGMKDNTIQVAYLYASNPFGLSNVLKSISLPKNFANLSQLSKDFAAQKDLKVWVYRETATSEPIVTHYETY